MRKTTKQITAFFTTALLLGSAAACHIDKKIASAELSKDYARTATETGAVTDEFKTALSDFSVSLFQKTLTKDNKNDLVSPLSAALCLALINNGAGGNTRAQLESLFGMQTDELNRSLYAYVSSLYSSKDCRVSIANSIWIRENTLNVKPAFLQTNADWYDAQVYASPFDQTTVTDINNWCYNNTDGKIDKIIDAVPPQAVMYLLNALDFDAKWQNKYERSDIHERTFYNYDGSTEQIDFLYSGESNFLYDDNAVGFTRAYKDNKYSFMALLPNEGVDIYEYIQGLSGESWLALWENSYTRPIYARIPEFAYEADLLLNDALQALGVTDIFSAMTADLSGIDETQPLYCNLVEQKTVIQLDRNGTKAAAITIGGLNMSAAPPQDQIYVTLDRPFVYAIVDNENQLPLFLGAVTNL